MNEQTDKIKICDIIADCFTKEENFTWNGRLVPKLANALIAAGLTFDGEWKHRAEVAEKAARDLIAYYCSYTIQRDIDSSLSVALQQAEKELEGKE